MYVWRERLQLSQHQLDPNSGRAAHVSSRAQCSSPQGADAECGGGMEAGGSLVTAPCVEEACGSRRWHQWGSAARSEELICSSKLGDEKQNQHECQIHWNIIDVSNKSSHRETLLWLSCNTRMLMQQIWFTHWKESYAYECWLLLPFHLTYRQTASYWFTDNLTGNNQN